jgi:hypothetical protein
MTAKTADKADEPKAEPEHESKGKVRIEAPAQQASGNYTPTAVAPLPPNGPDDSDTAPIPPSQWFGNPDLARITPAPMKVGSAATVDAYSAKGMFTATSVLVNRTTGSEIPVTFVDATHIQSTNVYSPGTAGYNVFAVRAASGSDNGASNQLSVYAAP